MFNMFKWLYRIIHQKTSDRKWEFPEVFWILQFTPYTFIDAWNTNWFKTKIIKNYKTQCKPRQTSICWFQQLVLLDTVPFAVIDPFFASTLKILQQLKPDDWKTCELQKGRAGSEPHCPTNQQQNWPIRQAHYLVTLDTECHTAPS